MSAVSRSEPLDLGKFVGRKKKKKKRGAGGSVEVSCFTVTHQLSMNHLRGALHSPNQCDLVGWGLLASRKWSLTGRHRRDAEATCLRGGRSLYQHSGGLQLSSRLKEAGKRWRRREGARLSHRCKSAAETLLVGKKQKKVWGWRSQDGIIIFLRQDPLWSSSFSVLLHILPLDLSALFFLFLLHWFTSSCFATFVVQKTTSTPV